MLVHVCPLYPLHITLQYIPTFLQLHLFLHPQKANFNSLPGAAGLSVITGLNKPSFGVHPPV